MDPILNQTEIIVATMLDPRLKANLFNRKNTNYLHYLDSYKIELNRIKQNFFVVPWEVGKSSDAEHGMTQGLVLDVPSMEKARESFRLTWRMETNTENSK